MPGVIATTAGAVLCALAAQATPASTALLVERTDPAYRAELRNAITDADPGVRAVAARVAAVRREGEMLPLLRTAAEVEQDPIAGAAQKIALAVIQQPVRPEAADRTTEPDALRTMPMIAPGLLSGLMKAVGCSPGKGGAYGIALMTFDSSGVASGAEVYQSQLPGKCRAVLETLARFVMADNAPSGVTNRRGLFVLPLDAEFVACADEPVWTELRLAQPQRTEPPRKIRDVKPEYPPTALRQRLSGVVFLEVQVTASGCIQNARVIRSPGPAFDLAAIRAVTGWGFEPARRAGQPVPFRMTTTVNFSVR